MSLSFDVFWFWIACAYWDQLWGTYCVAASWAGLLLVLGTTLLFIYGSQIIISWIFQKVLSLLLSSNHHPEVSKTYPKYCGKLRYVLIESLLWCPCAAWIVMLLLWNILSFPKSFHTHICTTVSPTYFHW